MKSTSGVPMLYNRHHRYKDMTPEDHHKQEHPPEPTNRARVEPLWRVSHTIDPARLEQARTERPASRPPTENYRRTK